MTSLGVVANSHHEGKLIISPDDLEAGKKYRFDFMSVSGTIVCELGVYTGTTVEHGLLWFCFDTGLGSPIPFDYTSLNNLREVIE